MTKNNKQIYTCERRTSTIEPSHWKPVTTPEIFKESFSYNLGCIFVVLAVSSLDCNDVKVLGSLKNQTKKPNKQKTTAAA